MLINSITEYYNEIKKDIEKWPKNYQLSWFRAEKENPEKPELSLLPKLYKNLKIKKTNLDKVHEIENNIIQEFRMRARAFKEIPNYERIDEWLFLMQHTLKHIQDYWIGQKVHLLHYSLQ